MYQLEEMKSNYKWNENVSTSGMKMYQQSELYCINNRNWIALTIGVELYNIGLEMYKEKELNWINKRN